MDNLHAERHTRQLASADRLESANAVPVDKRELRKVTADPPPNGALSILFSDLNRLN
jgi:hypothetical protein